MAIKDGASVSREQAMSNTLGNLGIYAARYKQNYDSSGYDSETLKDLSNLLRDMANTLDKFVGESESSGRD